MRLSDLLRKASTAFTLTDRLFCLPERFAAPAATRTPTWWRRPARGFGDTLRVFSGATGKLVTGPAAEFHPFGGRTGRGERGRRARSAAAATPAAHVAAAPRIARRDE